MKKILSTIVLALSALNLSVAQAQPAELILAREDGRITFAVDQVDPATSTISWGHDGMEIARKLNLKKPIGGPFSDWQPEIYANSFADEKDLHLVGEDVVFQMLLKAWCQHRPVVLSPDAIWLIICQQVSHCINQNPEDFRALLVNHKDKMTLQVKSEKDLLSGEADWPALIADFTSQIEKYTNNDIATTLVADFSTTGVDERVASEVTLMDAVKPYFKYEVIYAVCGIPSITLTGTPDDWRKVLEKTRALEAFGFGWWTSELEPILEEFVKAAEGNPDYWFWKDIVKKSRPQTIQGPTCGKQSKPQTKFDGWFLKLFPFDNEGRTPARVTITQNMLPETVVVPFNYKVVDGAGNALSETPMELVAGIVGVQEDAETLTLTPKIGWFVRSVKNEESKKSVQSEEDFLMTDPSVKYWDEGPLSLSDFPKILESWQRRYHFNYGFDYTETSRKVGNTQFDQLASRTFMNPFASWVRSDCATPQTLQYLQTIFDYAELYRRQDAADGQLDTFLEELDDETDSGRDSAKVQFYSKLVKDELARTPDLQSDDLLIYPKGFGMGMHGSIGYESYFGSVSSYFDPMIRLRIGFDFAFSRFLLSFDFQSTPGIALKKDLVRNGATWEAGRKILVGSIESALGYNVFDSQWWKFSPFVGIGAGFVELPREDEESLKDQIYGLRFLAGISTDFKYRRIISPAGSYSREPLEEYSIRLKVYVAHTNFPTVGPAPSINFSLGVSGIGWLLKR